MGTAKGADVGYSSGGLLTAPLMRALPPGGGLAAAACAGGGLAATACVGGGPVARLAAGGGDVVYMYPFQLRTCLLSTCRRSVQIRMSA